MFGATSSWTIAGTFFAGVAAAGTVWLLVVTLRDRAADVVVSVERRGTDDLAVIVASMRRGRPVTIHHAGVRLRDGSRKRLPQTTHYKDCSPRQVELKARHKIAMSVLLPHVWEHLIASGHGAQDIDVSFYLEDGAGGFFDWPEWRVANATTRTIELPAAET